MRSNRHSIFLLVTFALLCAVFVVACSNKDQRALDIPEGLASLTLKEFARQTDVEILFDRQVVNGVETHAIKGNYEPGYALRMMLADTPLGVNFEKDSGAYAIYKKQL